MNSVHKKNCVYVESWLHSRGCTVGDASKPGTTWTTMWSTASTSPETCSTRSCYKCARLLHRCRCKLRKTDAFDSRCRSLLFVLPVVRIQIVLPNVLLVKHVQPSTRCVIVFKSSKQMEWVNTHCGITTNKQVNKFTINLVLLAIIHSLCI